MLEPRNPVGYSVSEVWHITIKTIPFSYNEYVFTVGFNSGKFLDLQTRRCICFTQYP
jgi:hypothetical protein